VKDGVPQEVFTEVHRNPVNANPDDMRGNLRKAVTLLKEAGWEVKNGVLTNVKTGQPMRVEVLLVSPLFERIVQPYLRNLERLGIRGAIRMVDSAQYTRRLNVFDYDIVVGNFAQSESPGNEQRDFWGSEAADREGSQNLIGVKSAAIDKLVDHVIFAKDRSSSSPPPGRSIACSSGTSSWCRNGIRRACGSPIGTATASPRCCRR
jgi:microcin C transport system substrate-binding protein